LLSGFRCFLNIVEINQLSFSLSLCSSAQSLAALHEARANGAKGLQSGVTRRGARPSAERTVHGWCVHYQKEREGEREREGEKGTEGGKGAPAGGCECGGSKIMRIHGASMKYALATKDTQRSPSA
jgi:hypothetical protein